MKRVQPHICGEIKKEVLLFAFYLAGGLNKARRHYSLEEIVKLLSVQQVITVM